ncbi:MAG TPA: 5'-nucleotidase C-terminal domain-containing protein, partial [Mobilitalea sp.]|nr:5'-nucleotidase C-terminal domain-containing protein [Mobilitalea sp.]
AVKSGDKLPQIVSSNMVFPTDKAGDLTQSLTDLKKAMDNYGVKDYTVLERNGVKIGIFGVMGKNSTSMAPMSEVSFSDEVEQAKRVVKILKEQEKVDVIVCLSHSGTWADKSVSEDEILAKKVPEINVIISGHTHTELAQPILSGNTIIGSAGNYGRNLGVIKVTQQADGSWKLASYNLDKITDSLPEDEAISARVGDFKELVQGKYFDKFGLKYDEVVASSPFDFQTIDEVADNHREATLGDIISDSYIYAVKKAEGDAYKDDPVTAAIVPDGTIRSSIFKGDITTADIFSISSLGIGADKMPGYPLISVYLTGKELKTIAEVDASITPIMSEAQLFISGMNFTFNPNRLIFNKVEHIELVDAEGKVQPIDDHKLYRVVAGLYSAQMLSVVGDKSFGLLSIVPKTKDGKPITDFEAQIIYQTDNGNKRELKEWYALEEYLQSFDQVNGVSQIPQYYDELHGRKVVDDNKNIFAIVKNPNRIALTVYIAVPLILILIAFVIVRIIVRRRYKKLHKDILVSNKKRNKS